MAAMDFAKNTIKDSLKQNPRLLKEVMECYDKRWDNQMEQKLYGAALFLNPGKFFAIREKDRRQASKLRSNFNDVLWKMISDDDEQSKISKQADEYERSEGEGFSTTLAITDRDKKNPVLWWGAYGGLAYELQSLAKRIVGLCCSASGCERNWSTFAHVHTKKRNRLEHKRLNKLVYVSYNKKMANRFQKIRELGYKGRNYNPLILEEFHWENEWVDENSDLTQAVPVSDGHDMNIVADHSTRGRRAAAVAAHATSLSLSQSQTHARKRKRPVIKTRAIDDIVEDITADASNDNDNDEAEAEEMEMQEGESDAEMDEDSGGGEPVGATTEDGGGFALDESLL